MTATTSVGLSAWFCATSMTVQPLDAADLPASPVWIELPELINVPDIGGGKSDAAYTPLKSGQAVHVPGKSDSGVVDFTFADVPSDAGLTALYAAEDAGALFHPVKIEMPSGETVTFVASVQNIKITPGDGGSIMQTVVSLGVSSRYFRAVA